MTERTRPAGPAPWIAAALAAAAVLARTCSPGVPEMGDGVQHFQIARRAWHHPALLLDQWGKPLFTLLASPFAHAGPIGIVLFNALLAWLTCWCGLRVLAPAGRVSKAVFVVLTLMAPAFWGMVLAGMTEVLFAALTLSTVMLLHKQRHGAAAIIASLTPLARPEYVAFLPFVALWLAIERRWWAVLLCVTGLAVQGIATALAFGDPFWFWTHTPYGDGPSVYGSGPWWHFLAKAPEVFGWPLLVLSIGALIVWYPVQRRDAAFQRTHRVLFLTAAVPVLLTLAIHSWAWWKGVHGSAGVVRVLATVVPLTALFTVHTGWRAAALLAKKGPVLALLRGAAVLAAVAGAAMTVAHSVPIPAGADQLPLDGAADRLRTLNTTHAQVFSTHPYAAFRAGLDPYDEAQYRTVWSLQGRAADDYFPPGAYVFWDSQLGPNESQLPLDSLFPSPHFALEGVWHPAIGYHVVGDVPYTVYLFHRVPTVWEQRIDTLIAPGSTPRLKLDADSIAGEGPQRFGDGEFPLNIGPLPALDTAAAMEEWEFRANFHAEAEPDMRIVFKRTDGERTVRYDEERIPAGPATFRWRVSPVEHAAEQLFYIWDPGHRAFAVDGLFVIRHRWTQHPAP